MGLGTEIENQFCSRQCPAEGWGDTIAGPDPEFQIREGGAGPGTGLSSQVPRHCCWSGGHTLRASPLYSYDSKRGLGSRGI